MLFDLPLHPEHPDPLTGLPTRQELGAHLLALCGQGQGSLLLCDLDYLKLINDTLGHPAGDAALRDLAATLRGGLQPGWQAYRLGGDEFAVVAPVEAAGLQAWAGGVLAGLAARPGQPLQISAGVAGVCALSTPAGLLAQADRRLYAAKRRGRGRVVGDDGPSPPADHGQRLLERDEELAQLTARLRAALAEPQGGTGETLEIRALPGGGLSAFLVVADRTARLLGYRTLRLRGGEGRQLRQYGAWATATLNGVPLRGPPGVLPASDRPLALLFDRPEDFDPHTLEALGALRSEARLCINGSTLAGSKGDREGMGPSFIWLPPLSEGAVGAVAGMLGGVPLAGPVQAWLAWRSGGAPAEVERWLGALKLEAGLRGEDPQRLTASWPQRATPDHRAPEPGWQWSVSQHLNRPPHWERPYLWGRSAGMRAAADALQRAEPVVLTGPAGRGRTRLAEQLLMECGPGYPGGARVVPLAGTSSAGELLSRLAQALLGQPADLGGLDSLGRVLARRPTLLLLDDLSPGVGTGTLEQLLSFAPATRLIITAPHALGLRREVVLPVPLLHEATVRASLQQVASPGALTERALAWTGGEPARLQDVLRMLIIDASGGLLGDLLAGPSPHGGLPLGLAERQALAALGLFGDVFSLPWGQAVTGASPLMLSALREHGYLVSVGNGLYRLAGGLGMGKVLAPGPSAAWLRQARRRALQEVRRTLDDSTAPDRRTWLERLDAAYVPLRSLLTGLLRHGLPNHGPEAGLIDAVVALSRYRISRTYFLDARADLEQLLSQTSPAHGAAQTGVLRGVRLAEVRLALAQTLQHLGEYAPATALTGAVGTERQLPVAYRARALLIEARILHRRSEYPLARATYHHAQALLVRTRTARRAPELLAQALGGQARSLIYLDDLPEARRLIAGALETLGPDRDPLLRAFLLNTAGLIETEDRQLETAETHLNASLQLYEAHGDREGLILNRMGLTWVRLLRGDGEGSAALGRVLLREAQDAAQIWEIANILLNLGHAERVRGRSAEARRHYQHAEELVSEEDAPSLHAERLGGLAWCAHDEGNLDEARHLLAQALAHPGANAEVRHFFAPLQAALNGSGS
ncbi:diguanylate cyclase domain-containing protein [Deinococcus aerophilus]|uniref:GGDEF domain-containing protein n=1 Tax=Deinococcus aerophilus TaxID=522488 RepID=A0ABQ2GH96_9DEIO|nr:diguanylate cyclase [Deinococcus aerophilus]GGL96429.1 hypothetical protein GCM10010841_01020 [Deinococcus aerophilus]